MKNYLFIIFTLFLGTLLSSYTVEEIPNVHVKDKSQFVSDPDKILKPATVVQLNETIGNLWQTTSAEMTVAIVGTIGDAEINNFATELYGHWGIGKKDKSNGILILVVLDQRLAVIRTGYGSEGLLPDVICGRIIRNIMVPEFKKGDYDAGLINTVNYMHQLLTTPGAVEELKSKYNNDRVGAEPNFKEFFNIYLRFAVLAASVMFIWVAYTAFKNRKKNYFERYIAVRGLMMTSIIIAFLSLGMGFISPLYIWFLSSRYRNHKRKCPNCANKMHKLSEEEDNAYLKPSQDLEERLNSVDYDVWLCDNCGEADIYPFVNKQSAYQECPVCRTKSYYCVCDRVVTRPTPYREGFGVRTYKCLNCGGEHNTNYKIEKTADPTGAIIAGSVLGGLSGGRSGGSFGGGSFGGGMTGGGGASGGW